MKTYQPVIKWSGSKRPVAKTLSEYFVFGDTYFEPFVGGGAMMPYAKCNKGIAGDVIPELIELWSVIKNDPILVSDEYEKRWKELQEDGPDVYYRVRDSFNETRNCCDFLFITRTCVNGMIRFNDAGDFNNSFHLSRPGINPDTLRKIIFEWSDCISKFEFLNSDYRETLEQVKKNDFVFLDPPYGGTKDRYLKSSFDLKSFYEELDRLNSIGARWMLTFDGSAGSREYSYAPPEDLYKKKFLINTGKSSFTKVMNSKNDNVQESVYLNFDPVESSCCLI